MKETKTFMTIIGLVVIFIVLKELQDIFIPLVLAFFLYFVFSPFNHFLRKRKIPSFLPILLDFLILIVVFGGVSTIIVNSFINLGSDLPRLESQLNKIVTSTISSLGISSPEFTNFKISDLLKNINYKLLAGNIFSSTFSILQYLFLVIFFFIFVSAGEEDIYYAIKKRYLNLAKSRKKEETIRQNDEKPNVNEENNKNEQSNSIEKTFLEITKQIQKYIVVKFNISLITGFLEGGIAWLFGVDYALVWMVLIFLFNFIPAIGSLIGIALPFIMAIIQFGNFTTPIIMLVIILIVDNILGNYVEPRMYGQKLGFSPIFVLLALLIWGYIWGIIGMILSVPISSVIKIAISHSKSPNLIFFGDLMSGKSKVLE